MVERQFAQAQNLDDEIFRCHTMTNNIHVAFYNENVRVFNNELVCKSIKSWNDSLNEIVEATLCRHSVTKNNDDSGVKGFICAFFIEEVSSLF